MNRVSTTKPRSPIGVLFVKKEKTADFRLEKWKNLWFLVWKKGKIIVICLKIRKIINFEPQRRDESRLNPNYSLFETAYFYMEKRENTVVAFLFFIIFAAEK